MTETAPTFLARLALAWRTLVNAAFAADVGRLRHGRPAAAPTPARPAALKETAPESALQLLGLLQQEGRFIDFLQEDVAGYSDAEIGAAARVVHDGCRRALAGHLTLAPVRDEPENARITLAEGFDASAVRLMGNVVGRPPFTGTLVHRGWRVTEVKLPRIADGHNVRVLAPAEVEL
ncbi:MAG: DUF2760 domain-containing protein [Pseudomonadota bacterium]|nr:DUF2760 domain-containing protein [Pseudomonadota bacterium]